MRICIDLDGVVAELKEAGQDYSDVRVVPGASAALRKLRQEGHYLILHTARHMKTCHGDVGLVVARVGHVTLEWLRRHDIEFDEIHFGKPWADVYIDDSALRFTDWSEVEISTQTPVASRTVEKPLTEDQQC